MQQSIDRSADGNSELQRIAAIKMAFIRQQASLAHEYKTNITCFWSIAN
jgi:hypothetical protein